MSIHALARSFGIAAILWNVLASPSAFAEFGAQSPMPPSGCHVVDRAVMGRPAVTPHEPVFPPVQLEIRTPYEPAPLSSGGHNYLFYELYIQNFSSDSVEIRGIEVIDSDRATEELLAKFNAEQLRAILRPIGTGNGDDPQGLSSGHGVIAFLCLALEGSVPVPNTLRHRVLLDDLVAEGPAVGIKHDGVRILGSPVSGPGWTPAGYPSIHSHHRSGVLVAGGRAQISRRYALDWKKLKQDASFSGDALDVRSYYSYGENVLAVAEGVVHTATDGLPDNVPRTAAGFATAVPITMGNVAGNFIVLDLGEGQFAYYAHLQPGSVSVRAGDRVVRGQVLARIGNSGDAREPHLHFQVTTSPDIFASEGLPYVIDAYRMKPLDGTWQTRTREFPLGDIVVDFGAGPTNPNK